MIRVFVLVGFMLFSCAPDEACMNEFNKTEFCLQVAEESNLYKARMAMECLRDGSPEYECMQIMID